MSRLIIGRESISFNDEGIYFTGQVARLIAGDEIIFLVKYTAPGNNTATLKKVKRNFIETSSRFGWFNYPGNEQDEFSKAIGEEIEKHPHLLSFIS